MAVGLQLLARRRFEIILSDGTIVPGRFSTAALDLFARSRNNATLSEISNYFIRDKKNPDGSTALDEKGEPIVEINTTIKDIVDYILCACQAALPEGVKLKLTGTQLMDWADDYTFETGEPGALGKIYTHSASVEKKSDEPQPTQ